MTSFVSLDLIPSLFIVNNFNLEESKEMKKMMQGKRKIEVDRIIVLLRYGPKHYDQPKYSLHSYRKISSVVGMSITYCREVALRYIAHLAETKDSRNTKTRKQLRLEREQAVKRTDLLPEHIDFITCRETLTRQIGMTLEERTLYFMLKYPSKKICTQTLTRLYAKHKIRRKKIKITKLLTPVLRRRIKKQTAEMAE
jgi:hypothetical protein